MKRSIVWFTTDLRLNDNEALFQAIVKSDEIIPVYCFDDAHFKTTNFGFKKIGNFRAQFLIESLIDLDKNGYEYYLKQELKEFLLLFLQQR